MLKNSNINYYLKFISSKNVIVGNLNMKNIRTEETEVQLVHQNRRGVHSKIRDMSGWWCPFFFRISCIFKLVLGTNFERGYDIFHPTTSRLVSGTDFNNFLFLFEHTFPVQITCYQY